MTTEYQMRVLEALDGGEWHRRYQLAVSLGTTQQALAGALRRLRTAGLVERGRQGYAEPDCYRLTQAGVQALTPGSDASER